MTDQSLALQVGLQPSPRIRAPLTRSPSEMGGKSKASAAAAVNSVPDESGIFYNGPAPSEPPAGTPVIDLDAREWRVVEDAYAVLLPAIGAPHWHGHNLDALNDSLVTGSINSRPRHFHVRIQTASGEAPRGGDPPAYRLRRWYETLQEIFAAARGYGIPIWMSSVVYEG